MTQEEKQLLLTDLCCRLPYGVIIQRPDLFRPSILIDEKLEEYYKGNFGYDNHSVEFVKPYLRPISSMTEEEDKKRIELGIWRNTNIKRYKVTAIEKNIDEALDWLNAHHFDYRNLIGKGLALEAPKDMYKVDE